MIKALFCDFYGTVVLEDDEPINTIIEHIYKYGNGNAHRKSEIGTYWWQRFSTLCADSYGDNFRMQRELEIQSLLETLERFDVKEDAVKLCEPQFEYWKAPLIFSDSKLFFSKCFLPIYIVSNIDTADLNSALKYNGLETAGIVTSEEARAYKPRQEIFNLALSKFGLKPNEVIHMGDSITSDVMGAKAAGIQSIWINRKGKPNPLCPCIQSADLINVLTTHVTRDTTKHENCSATHKSW